MTTKPFFLRCAFFGILIGLAVAYRANAQVSTINSVVLNPREFNDVPGAFLNVVNNYPSVISFTEFGVSAPSGFANRDVWRFSNNGGSTAYQFQNNDYIQVSMTLRLQGSPTSPRKEAGYLFTTLGGDGQFLVNTDAGEIVAFGGPLPFYSFNASNGLSYTAGDTITLGMTYFNHNGVNSIIYSANGINSPILPFTNLELGIIDGSALGGYFQIVNDSANPFNSGIAEFGTISIVPEPSTFAMLSLGILTLGLVVARRRF